MKTGNHCWKINKSFLVQFVDREFVVEVLFVFWIRVTKFLLGGPQENDDWRLRNCCSASLSACKKEVELWRLETSERRRRRRTEKALKPRDFSVLSGTQKETHRTYTTTHVFEVPTVVENHEMSKPTAWQGKIFLDFTFWQLVYFFVNDTFCFLFALELIKKLKDYCQIYNYHSTCKVFKLCSSKCFLAKLTLI